MMEVLEFRHVAAALHIAPTIVWAILAASFCHCHGTARPGGVLSLFRILCSLFATHYGLSVVLQLAAPGAIGDQYPVYSAACGLTQLTTLALMPVFHHLLAIGSLDAGPPRRSQFLVTYGAAVAIAFTVRLAPQQLGSAFVQSYLLAMTVLILVQTILQARRGWRPTLMAHLGRGSYLVLALVLLAGVITIVITEQAGDMHNPALVLSHTLVGLVAAAPFALRILGEVVRQFLLTMGTLVAVTTAYVAFDDLGSRPLSLDLARLVDFAAVATLVVILVPGRAWLRRVIDRAVLRRSLLWAETLQRFGAKLSPESGLREITRTSVDKIVRVMQFRGAAIHLESDNEWIASQHFDLTGLRRSWVDFAAQHEELPERAFDLLWLDDRSVRTALYEAQVTWIVPISTTRGRWGHLFVASGVIGSAGAHGKLQVLESFAQQLARVLDVAALLDRARSAERSLAEAEKLAVLGETAARIAHEIRNPITAARCLAQLLADGSGSELDREHAELITKELDRVEREVKTLLDFARREQYQLSSIDLGQLIRSTLADLDALLSPSEIKVDLQLDSGVIVEGDAEKLRQVLVNLVVNARDALAGVESRRWLTVVAEISEQEAVVVVEDSGRGIEPELLPRLFEPFVTKKSHGTGLGLAIVKRIVEAHGGTISASTSRRWGGLAIRMSLPLDVPLSGQIQRAV